MRILDHCAIQRTDTLRDIKVCIGSWRHERPDQNGRDVALNAGHPMWVVRRNHAESVRDSLSIRFVVSANERHANLNLARGPGLGPQGVAP
jgi:hypothetical protein